MPPTKTAKKSQTRKLVLPKVVPSPVKVETRNIGRSRAPSLAWEVPEWDLAEIGRIIDVDGIANKALSRKRDLFIKEGYELVGPNPQRVKYIKKRFSQMENATGIPFPTLISQSAWSLARLHNVFWVKARKVESSGGRVRKTPNGKELNPIAGYFPMAAETVKFKRDVIFYNWDENGSEEDRSNKVDQYNSMNIPFQNSHKDHFK